MRWLSCLGCIFAELRSEDAVARVQPGAHFRLNQLVAHLAALQDTADSPAVAAEALAGAEAETADAPDASTEAQSSDQAPTEGAASSAQPARRARTERRSKELAAGLEHHWEAQEGAALTTVGQEKLDPEEQLSPRPSRKDRLEAMHGAANIRSRYYSKLGMDMSDAPTSARVDAAGETALWGLAGAAVGKPAEVSCPEHCERKGAFVKTLALNQTCTIYSTGSATSTSKHCDGICCAKSLVDEPAVWRIKGAKMKRMSLTWDFLVKNGMALPGKGGGIGPRLVQTILRCADTQPGPLRVPVWGTMTEVECVPFEHVVRGAQLAQVKLASADVSQNFQRLMHYARAALFGEKDAGDRQAASHSLAALVGQLVRENRGVAEKVPNWFGWRDALEHAARWNVPLNVLESATVIQDTSSRAQAVLNVYGGGLKNSRAAHFYRTIVEAVKDGLPAAKSGIALWRILNAVEYLAELGKGAGAVDMALFRDFIVMELVEASMDLHDPNRKPTLQEVYTRYCESHPEGPLGPGPDGIRARPAGEATTRGYPERSCLGETRDIHAFVLFAFGVLDPLHEIVRSRVAPVCGSGSGASVTLLPRAGHFSAAGYDNETFSEHTAQCSDPHERNTCLEGEVPWCPTGEHQGQMCCCTEDGLDASVGVDDDDEIMVLKHPRAPTAVLPIRTCSSERLRLLQLKSERYAELEAREAEAEKEPIESIRPSVRHY